MTLVSPQIEDQTERRKQPTEKSVGALDDAAPVIADVHVFTVRPRSIGGIENHREFVWYEVIQCVFIKPDTRVVNY